MNRSRIATRYGAALGVVALFSNAATAPAAEQLVATMAGSDFDLSVTPVQQTVTFNEAGPITGVGFTADWTAVIADNEDGLFPWSLDLNPVIEAPNGELLDWPVVGGDRTIADYPLQDFHSGFNNVSGDGQFTWTFNNSSPQAPYTMGLRNVQLHLTTQVPDVVEVRNDTTEGGPLWNRPFFINGISGLGPVAYHVIEFEVPVSGGYTFLSVTDSGDSNFTFLCQDGFDPGDPNTPGDTGQLANLLDYGLGNGNAPNGTPQGTSRIEALLFEGERYYYVTSQWSEFVPAQPFTTTITGPAMIDVIDCTADIADDDFTVNVFDLLALLANWGTDGSGADLAEPNDVVDVFDLLALLAAWGACP